MGTTSTGLGLRPVRQLSNACESFLTRKHLFQVSPKLAAFLLAGFLAAFMMDGGVTAGAVGNTYSSGEALTDLPFGVHSHWLQPWRSYQETPSATQFVNGLGMNFNTTGQDPDLMMRMLATHGIRHVRIEIGWGMLSYDETHFAEDGLFRAKLAAAKKYGVRPLILLNSNDGLPCPTRFAIRAITVAAPAGATQLQLDDVSGIIPGYSGFSNMTKYWAAEVLITAVNGNNVQLSKPLAVAVPAGTKTSVATLRYRPFSVPGSASYQASMDGWLRYVDKVNAFVADALGTSGAQDKAYDLEIWNELTFGSNFLYVNTYYATPQYTYDQQAIWWDLVTATAKHLDANPSAVSGVAVSDGIASTTPWQASSLEQSRIGALSKHPYPRLLTFPADDQRGNGLAGVNALGQFDTYAPSYTTRFPEYYGTAIQTETAVRDMIATPNLVGSVAHGRDARIVGGRIAPVGVWITEINQSPSEIKPSIGAAEALALKAKTSARIAAFFLNKGVSQLDFFGATGGDTDVGMVQDNFLAYAQPGAAYPASDAQYTSPALTVLQRMSARMSDQLDRSLTTPRAVQVVSISDRHNHYQFAGDGSRAHPPLYDRDTLAVLPFQVNARKFIVPYYVMTRDILQLLAPEQFTVQLQGINGTSAAVSVYDPIKNVSVPTRKVASTSTLLTLQLTATDYPYLLTIQD